MILHIKIHPNSGREEIIKLSEDSYKVYLKKQATGNKANIELLKFLKKYFSKDIKIIKGLKSRNKVIKIGE
ncbi:YggU family protein [Candidatus Pacearchaeota archaeon]|nr:YggU family protein [Candidatus Pacearchaeota archaeon]